MSSGEAEHRAERLAEVRAQRHWTYVARGADGSVLYVGCTRNPIGRMRTHKAKSAWFELAASVDWQRWADYATGRAAEKDLIRSLRPLHNKQQMRPMYHGLRVAS